MKITENMVKSGFIFIIWVILGIFSLILEGDPTEGGTFTGYVVNMTFWAGTVVLIFMGISSLFINVGKIADYLNNRGK